MPIAQVNIAKMIAPIDSEIMADFVAQTAEVNALADVSKGFVWRLEGDGVEQQTGIRAFPQELTYVVNMSVWETVEDLYQFTYHNQRHREVMMQRKKWFEKMEKMHMVIWNIEEGHIPTLEEAKERIEYLWANGDSDYAFTFKYLKDLK